MLLKDVDGYSSLTYIFIPRHSFSGITKAVGKALGKVRQMMLIIGCF